jgi:hypothetical protein
MPVARSIDLPFRPSLPSGVAKRSITTQRAALAAGLVALALALLGCAYFGTGTGTGEGFPDSTQQWTD